MWNKNCKAKTKNKSKTKSWSSIKNKYLQHNTDYGLVSLRYKKSAKNE